MASSAPASFESEVSLPTLKKLGVSDVPTDINAHQIATVWLQRFSEAIDTFDIDAVVSLFLLDGIWRDMLALTWTFRTIFGTRRIRAMLESRLQQTKLTSLKLAKQTERPTTVFKHVPGLFCIQSCFEFETAIGAGSGVFRIVPTSNGEWKAHVVYTNLESLRGSPFAIGPLRSKDFTRQDYISERAAEVAFQSSDPKVLVIGGGQSGLAIAARLKYLNVPTLVLEKNPRIGDNWRNRFEGLTTHHPSHQDHLPYLNFPRTWPLYTPAHKLADWLEFYAAVMELNVWTSTTVESVDRDGDNGDWLVDLIKSDGTRRTLRPKHIVVALGFNPKVTEFPGMDEFEGEIVQDYRTAKAYHQAKRAIVVGTGNTGHDAAEDLYHHGLDVTMVQRSSTFVLSLKKGLPIYQGGLYEESGPSVETADLIMASVPMYMGKLVYQMRMKAVMHVDQELYQGLGKAGFKLNYGDDNSGFVSLLLKDFGGYYIDVGASQLIIDGKIKIKNGGINKFTKTGLEFDDGTTLDADVIVLSTGVGDVRDPVRAFLAPNISSKIKPVRGLDREGEPNSMWTDCSVPDLYFMMGNLQFSRIHSLHVALQIKAKEEGLYSAPYTE